jgi:oxysterol-binding protein 1
VRSPFPFPISFTAIVDPYAHIDSRSFLNASYRSLLRTYILSPPTAPPDPALLSLLESPRIRFVNVSYLDDSTGTSLLHEAAKRKDLRLIELAVRAGVDVFVRDRRGRMAYDGVAKDDRVRVFLRQCQSLSVSSTSLSILIRTIVANQDTTLIDVSQTAPTILKGYLNKYTNVARGYSTRWFVLKGGVLSCSYTTSLFIIAALTLTFCLVDYRHQEDETVASRGSISMKTAILKTSPAEKLRFEVHSIPSHGHHSGVQKWYMKANHPVEASRWTQAIKKSIEWCKRETSMSTEKSTEKRRKSMDMESESSSTLPVQSSSSTTRFTKRSVAFLRSKRRSESASISSSYLEPTPDGYVSEDLSSYLHDGGGLNASSGGEVGDNDDGDGDGDGGGGGDGDDDSLEVNATAPHDTAFELHGNSTIAQMELTSRLLAGVIDSPDPDSALLSGELRSGLRESFAIAQGLVNEYVRMAKERDAWWKVNLERERMNQSVWEESLASAVKDGEVLERELRNRSRKRGSRSFADGGGGGGGGGTVRQRPKVSSPTSSTRQIFLVPPPETPASSTMTPTPVTIPIMPTMSSEPDGDMQNEDIETDEEDEFFDAIESNTIPNLVVAKSFEQPGGESECVLPPDANLEQYEGYKNLRTRLSIGNDERPSTSLWSVLKHSIGKDLTRISFPVFFNEPTSMLQRMVSLPAFFRFCVCIS